MVETQQNSLLGKIAAYTEILATDPDSTIFVSLSEAYRKMGMLEDAFAVATQGLKLLPDYCPGYVVLARIKCQQRDLSGSEEAFRHALDLDHGNLAALVGFSRLCLLQDRISEARSLLLRARDLSPADSVINKLLLSLPDPEIVPVVETTSIPLQIVPEAQPNSTYEPFESATLADLYRKQGLLTKSLDIYRNLLFRNPDNLEYRRFIRDLETTISTQNANQIVQDPEIPIARNLPENSDAEMHAPVENTQSKVAFDHVDTPFEQIPVLDQFNRLLASIQKRRGDV